MGISNDLKKFARQKEHDYERELEISTNEKSPFRLYHSKGG